ncbi:MAG: hypothetical protein ACT4PV_02300 [Planctomycetaceae bacterium]
MLDRLRIPSMVMGGFAVRAWAVPRPTYDADLAVSADGDLLPRLLREFAAAAFDVPPEHAQGFADRIGGMEKLKVTRVAGGSV